jgi:predicted aldo/keto reductase-like oxidoreductase
MKYRKFGNLGWEASVLGFGAMRLPIIGKDPTHVDEQKAIEMIRYAIDHGVNYLDTARKGKVGH